MNDLGIQMFIKAAICHNKRFSKGASPDFVKRHVIKLNGKINSFGNWSFWEKRVY